MGAHFRWPAPPPTAAALFVCVAALGCSSESPSPRLEAKGDTSQCIENLRALYGGLVEYAERRGGPPPHSGVAFFGSLVAEGIWPADAEHFARLTCPGSKAPLAGAELPLAERWRDLARVDEGWSAYAGRDQERAPLASLPGRGSEVLVACDNHLGPNHTGITNALCADGSVVSFEVALEIEAGNLPKGAAFVPVGPDSPIALLRSLRPDPLP